MGKHWTDNVWMNKTFLSNLRNKFGDTMFSFADAKDVYYENHGYWKKHNLKCMIRPPDEAKTHTLKDSFFTGTVGNFIAKAVYTGYLIKICPGWYMLPLEEEDAIKR